MSNITEPWSVLFMRVLGALSLLMPRLYSFFRGGRKVVIVCDHLQGVASRPASAGVHRCIFPCVVRCQRGLFRRNIELDSFHGVHHHIAEFICRPDFLLQAKVRQRYFDDGVCFLFFFVPSSWLWCPGVTPDFDIFVSSTGNFNIGTSDHM